MKGLNLVTSITQVIKSLLKNLLIQICVQTGLSKIPKASILVSIPIDIGTKINIH
jgi:hypothetical protein